jgi:hypothetical protein
MPGLLIQSARSNTLGNCALVSQSILLPQICNPARADSQRSSVLELLILPITMWFRPHMKKSKSSRSGHRQ